MFYIPSKNFLLSARRYEIFTGLCTNDLYVVFVNKSLTEAVSSVSEGGQHIVRLLTAWVNDKALKIIGFWKSSITTSQISNKKERV